MGELTLFESGKVPAHLRSAEPDELTKSLIGGGGGGKRISIKGGVFRLLSNGEEIAKSDDRAMNMVIVKSSPIYRTYFKGKFVEGENKAPDCWSTDTIVPSPDVKNPQSTSCQTCPQNIKGSGTDNSRACRYHQRLAVVLENDMDGDVYQINVPATSIFGKVESGKAPLQAYAAHLLANKANANSVVTEFRFDTDAATPKLIFKAVRWLDDTEYESAKAQGQSIAATNAVTMLVNQADGDEGGDEGGGEGGDSPAIKEPPKSKQAAKKDASKADSSGDNIPEPTKREPSGEKTDDSINKTLDEWDNDDVT